RSRRRLIQGDPPTLRCTVQQLDRRQGSGGAAANDGDVVVAVHRPIVATETVCPALRGGRCRSSLGGTVPSHGPATYSPKKKPARRRAFPEQPGRRSIT